MVLVMCPDVLPGVGYTLCLPVGTSDVVLVMCPDVLPGVGYMLCLPVGISGEVLVMSPEVGYGSIAGVQSPRFAHC